MNNVNFVLEKSFDELTKNDIKVLNEFFIKECEVERMNLDRKGIYGLVQKELAFNSNRIEGSTLTKDQTASLFDKDVVYDDYCLKDIEEMRGHFLMFNHMLDTINQPLSEDLIKQFHYQLKIGVFEDRANGYAIGDYKRRPNIVGNTPTANPLEVRELMPQILNDYNNSKKSFIDITEFHKKYESIHPFQDGNGRTGRIIMFRECLKNDIIPFIVQDKNKELYIKGFHSNNINMLCNYFKEEQKDFYSLMQKMLYRYIDLEKKTLTKKELQDFVNQAKENKSNEKKIERNISSKNKVERNL